MGSGLRDHMVRYLYPDQEGNFWIGINGNRNGGVDKFVGIKYRNLNESNGLCGNNVAVIFQSSDGIIWLASNRETLCYFENGNFKSLNKLSGISIRTIIEDKDGILWKYDRKKLTDLTQLKNEYKVAVYHSYKQYR